VIGNVRVGPPPLAYAMSPGDRELSNNEPVVQLGILAAAANLTSNAIANIIFTADAHIIFKHARSLFSVRARHVCMCSRWG